MLRLNLTKLFAIAALALLFCSTAISSYTPRGTYATSYSVQAAVTPQSIILGSSILVSGQICPNPTPDTSVGASVTFTRPDGSTFTDSNNIGYGDKNYCSSSSTFDTIVPDMVGTWVAQVEVSWSQNFQQQLAMSNSLTFTVSSANAATTTQSTIATTQPSTTPQSTYSSSQLTPGPTTVTTTVYQGPTSQQSTNGNPVPTTTVSQNPNSEEYNFTSQLPPVPQGLTLKGNQSEGALSIHAGNFAYVNVSVSTNSILGYDVQSNVSVYTAVLTDFEFASYQTLWGHGFLTNENMYGSNGTTAFNALLLTPGSYHVLFVSPPEADVNLTYVIMVEQNLELQNQTTYFGGTISIPPAINPTVLSDFQPDPWTALSEGNIHYQPLQMATLGSPFILQIFAVSNASTIFVLDDMLRNTTIVESPPVTVTNLTTSSDGSIGLGYTFILPPSIYGITMINTNPSDNAYVYLTYTITPAYVNPYLASAEFQYNMTHVGTGVTCYGVYNVSGRVTPYEIDTNSIVGFAQINSLKESNPNVPPPIASDEASLQLNTILKITNLDGSVQYYWPQNTALFLTNSSQIVYRNNVLNVSGDLSYLTNETIRGAGFVDGYQGQYYYGNYMNPMVLNYSLPLTILLYMNDSVVQGQGVWINMGVRTLQNGTAPTGNNSIVWFDKIFIVDPNIYDAHQVVDGSHYLPVGTFSQYSVYVDAELVWGGGGNDATGIFPSMDSKLALYYYDNSTLKPFPSLYTFSGDTGESAVNLTVSLNQAGGYAHVVNSRSHAQGFLTNNFTSSLSLLEGQLRGAVPPLPNNVSQEIMAGAVGAVVAAGGLVFYSRKRRQHGV